MALLVQHPRVFQLQMYAVLHYRKSAATASYVILKQLAPFRVFNHQGSCSYSSISSLLFLKAHL